jgi:hypothetical protein
MEYPARLIKAGERDRAVVRAVQARLRELGCLPLDAAGTFAEKTRASVRLFQARHVDLGGRALKQDGIVGSLTWAALFGAGTVPHSTEAVSPLLRQVLKQAGSQVGVVERPKDSNSGPEVDGYLRRVGIPAAWPKEKKAWCCAFVFACFDEAAAALGRLNPMVKTAGCLHHWNHAETKGARRLTAGKAIANPALVSPGMVFVIDHGQGRGHTGFVEEVRGGMLHTIEGNTDASLTREGGGVYRLARKVLDVNMGYIDYGGVY